MNNQEKLKLIWDFKGPAGKRTAEHHAIHLKEYAERAGMDSTVIGFEELSEMHSIAFFVVSRDKMIKVRDDLKPHRGQLYDQKS